MDGSRLDIHEPRFPSVSERHQPDLKVWILLVGEQVLKSSTFFLMGFYSPLTINMVVRLIASVTIEVL